MRLWWALASQRWLVLALVAGVVPATWAQGGSTSNPTDTESAKAAAGRVASRSDSSQASSFQVQPGEDPHNRLVTPFLKHLVSDQKEFWTGPTRFTVKDLRWALPFTGITAGLIASDSWLSKQVPDKPNQLNRSLNISDYSVYALIGVGGGAFLFGHLTKNDHMSETGLLAGEAAINSTGITYLLKGITQRPRPYQDNGNGTFFQGGASFTSEHSAIAWSIASVVAHEYPGTLSQILAYGLATTVTVTRVTARQHFPSDVFVGSALGWYFGRQAYRAHHDPQLPGAAWGNFYESDESVPRKPRKMASPYMPLDSWIYPAFDRLAGLGLVQSAYMDQRPWTRLECARLVEEAGEKLPEGETSNDEVSKLYRELSREFSDETARLNGAPNLGIGLESVYTRVTGISGPPLRDSYHFGQTLVNDYGRPYAEGANIISGISATAVAGPLAFYARGEYQQAPSTPLYPYAALQDISIADVKPFFPNATAPISRISLLDSQVALSLGNLQISFGNQSTWLGPSRSGSLLLSNNAAPFTMLRFESVSPFRVPGLSRLLGPVKTEFFIGQLTGHTWISNGTVYFGPEIDPQPYVHGDRIVFHPTNNMEMGMGIVVMFAGQSLPFTWSNFLRTYYVHTPNTAVNPGKRFSAFDFSYRIPHLRKWITAYYDSLVVDEVSPILSGRPSINPGLYFPQIPKIPNLQFRVEGIKTQQGVHPAPNPFPPGFVYTDRRYKNGYTNGGDLIMGNWIGRAGIGTQAWATYNFSPRSNIELSYRHVNVDHSFLEGGHMNDFSATSNWMFRPGIGVSTMLQYEQWGFPLLAPAAKSNMTVSLQLTFWPTATNRGKKLFDRKAGQN